MDHLLVVEQPSGTVTLVFTDIEGSTRLLHELGQGAYRDTLAEHRRVVREACARHAGYEVDYEGDSFFYAFGSAVGAVAAVEEVMRELAGGPIRLRVGIHTGEPGLDPPKYVGLDVHRAARIMSAAHGGQVLLSDNTYGLVDVVARDLGEHRLKDIAELVSLYQLGEEEFPPPKSLNRTNLPIPATPFLGRERELQELDELLSREDVRLLTLTGPGGTGKTRLALHTVGELASEFPHGVFLVSLQALTDPGLVISQIAQTLGVRESGTQPLLAAIREWLTGKRLLLVLDNFEQLLPAATEIGELLAGSPELRLIVTSRVPLRLSAEREYPVPPLALPPDTFELQALAQNESVMLFVGRAQAVRPDFRLTSENASFVSAICRGLDGLPLALELAAARVRTLSPQALLTRLGQKLELLTGGARDRPARQQTLRATIEWSYGLLEPSEQAVFQALAVFAGGCALESAQAVCADSGDIFETLALLVEKNVLGQTEGFDSEPRFSLLATIKEYAVERLEESGRAPALRHAHAEHFLALAERGYAGIHGSEEPAVLDRLDAELDNFRAALAWSLETEPDWALQLAALLGRFWHIRGHWAEARHWLDTVLAQPHEPSQARFGQALHAGAVFALDGGDYERARSLSEQSLAVARAQRSFRSEINALTTLGLTALRENDIQAATDHFSETLGLARKDGYPPLIATALTNLADAAYCAGDYTRAADLNIEAARIARELEDKSALTGILGELAATRLRQGEPAEARSLFHESLTLALELGDHRNMVTGLLQTGVTEAATRPTQALRLIAAAEAAQRQLGLSLGPNEVGEVEQALTRIREQLSDHAWTRAREEGARLSLEAAAQEALRLLAGGQPTFER